MNMNYAPICLFTYNRLEETKHTIAALKNNFLATDSDLFIFLDGPKNNQQIKSVTEVGRFIKSVKGFKSVTIKESNTNKGLANSITSGVSEIISLYGKVIVLEDDLITSSNFLSYMNESLDYYESNSQIFSISGFSVKVSPPRNYTFDNYIWGRAHSWGWATWKNRWSSIDWEIKDYDQFLSSKKDQKKFNTYGSDLTSMLKKSMSGKINSWYIKFTYNQFRQNKFSVYPIFSKIINNGFTDNATHCNTYNRIKLDFDTSNTTKFNFLNNVIQNKEFYNQVYRYKSIRYRAMGRILTSLMRNGIIRQKNIQIN